MGLLTQCGVAGALPADVAKAIPAWGAWGQVTEASDSATRGNTVLNGTANVLLNLLQSVPVTVDPYQVTLQAGQLGPYVLNVTLGEVCGRLLSPSAPLGCLQFPRTAERLA